jgi:hypothetical protein
MIDVIQYDWKGIPTLKELTPVLNKFGVNVYEVDTQSDSYAFVLSDVPLSKEHVRVAYSRKLEGGTE